jgi:hypothetical protein
MTCHIFFLLSIMKGGCWKADGSRAAYAKACLNRCLSSIAFQGHTATHGLPLQQVRIQRRTKRDFDGLDTNQAQNYQLVDAACAFRCHSIGPCKMRGVSCTNVREKRPFNMQEACFSVWSNNLLALLTDCKYGKISTTPWSLLQVLAMVAKGRLVSI